MLNPEFWSERQKNIQSFIQRKRAEMEAQIQALEEHLQEFPEGVYFFDDLERPAPLKPEPPVISRSRENVSQIPGRHRGRLGLIHFCGDCQRIQPAAIIRYPFVLLCCGCNGPVPRAKVAYVQMDFPKSTRTPWRLGMDVPEEVDARSVDLAAWLLDPATAANAEAYIIDGWRHIHVKGYPGATLETFYQYRQTFTHHWRVEGLDPDDYDESDLYDYLFEDLNSYGISRLVSVHETSNSDFFEHHYEGWEDPHVIERDHYLWPYVGPMVLERGIYPIEGLPDFDAKETVFVFDSLSDARSCA